jgi:hypothetical protein
MSNVPTQPQTLTPSILTDNKPGFFDILPRELRDIVYDSLYQKLDNDADLGLRYQTYTVCTELRLVSRQFKLEYDERTSVDQKSRHLTVSIDLCRPCWCELPVDLPSPQLAARTVHLTLVVTFCDGEHSWDGVSWECSADEDSLGVLCYRDFMEVLVNALPCLQSLRMNLQATADLCVMNLLEFSTPFRESPKLTELRIMGPCLEECTPSPLAQVAIWTEQDGLQQDEEAIKLCRKRALPQQLE